MLEYDYRDFIAREIDLPMNIEKRIQEIREALQRMKEGKIKKIVIFRKGPIQES